MKFLGFPTGPRILAWTANGFLAALAFTILAYGSNTDIPLSLSAIVFGVMAGVSAWRPIPCLAVRQVYLVTVLLLAALLGYIYFQTLPDTDRANEAWRWINVLVGPVRGSISVAPGMTRDAMVKLALPFLVFLSGLSLFQGDAGALGLWRALAYFGAAYAVFGILQELLFPNNLVFASKAFYVGFLTASFVNRNTAGTFFGFALLLNLGMLFYKLRSVRIRSFVERLMAANVHWRDRHGSVLMHAALCLVVAVALFLTQSRGAVGASFVGAAMGVILMMRRSLTADGPLGRLSGWRRNAVTAAATLVLLGLFVLLAGRSAYRLQEQGSDDLRWCAFASTFQAIEDHPLFGTGFATFRDVFPVYRNEACVGIRNVWDHAHNFFLEGYLGLGAPFAIAVVLVYGVCLGAFVYGIRQRRRLRFIPVMALAALCLASLHALVDFSLQIPGFAVYFAAVMASGVTASLGRT